MTNYFLQMKVKKHELKKRIESLKNSYYSVAFYNHDRGENINDPMVLSIYRDDSYEVIEAHVSKLEAIRKKAKADLAAKQESDDLFTYLKYNIME